MSVKLAEVLQPERWRSVAATHEAEVDVLTAGHRLRSSRHTAHPVEDFLHTYYSLRPAQLRRWYPGACIGLVDAPERSDWRFHRTDNQVTSVDVAEFLSQRGEQLGSIRNLLAATGDRTAQFGCFGLHEWAMVYRQTPESIRHGSWPLRLGAAGTDAVVDGSQIKCSHYDAYRFFTEPARELNLLRPQLDTRQANEQPGCLHAGMDLYKWAYKLIPAVSSSLLLSCYRLARDIRTIDMRASPYDLTDLGYLPIPIETPAGKAEYVGRQREFAERSTPLRQRLIQVCDAVLG